MAIKASGLLDTEQVAIIFGCSSKHVRDLIRGKINGKKLPAFKIGRNYKIKREDAFKFLEKCRIDEEKYYE